MSLAKLFRARASRSHASERNCCLGLPGDNNHCHSRMQAVGHANDTAASHPVLQLPHVVDVGCRGISGEACRYVAHRRRPACVFCSHVREIETGIRRLLPLWLDWYRRFWPCLESLRVLISLFETGRISAVICQLDCGWTWLAKKRCWASSRGEKLNVGLKSLPYRHWTFTLVLRAGIDYNERLLRLAGQVSNHTASNLRTSVARDIERS